MAEVGVAFVSIAPSTKNFGAKLNSQIAPAATAAGTTSGKKFGGTFMGASKSALKGFGAIFAVGAVTAGIKSVVAEAREAQKIGALTANIIKTTGGAANVSAAQVGKLADSISRKTAIDDETIQSGANLILTFKNVRNEVGKGNQVFSRATAAAADLSSVKGMGGIEGASKQLGKALNDPVKGLGALSRAGVTFTAGQQKQIKAMVKSGDTLGAQKIILKEVESQFKGAAASQATAGDKLRNSFNQLKEQIGTALLPAVDSIATVLSTKVVPAVSKLITFLQANPGVVKAFAIAVAAVAAGFVVAFVAGNALIIGLSLLGAAVVAAFVKFPILRTIVTTVFKVIKTVVLTVIKIVVAVVKAGIRAVIATWNFIKRIPGIVSGAFNAVRGFISGAISKVVSVVSTGVKKVIQFFKELPGKVLGFLRSLPGKLLKVGKNIVNGLVDGIKAAPGKIKDAILSLLPGPLRALAKQIGIASPSKVMAEMGKNLSLGLAQGIIKGQPAVAKAMGSLGDMTLNSAVATLPPGGPSGPRLSGVGPSSTTNEGWSLVGARVEMGKDGFGYFVDGRIQRNTRNELLAARFG